MERTDEELDGWMEWTDEQLDGWMDGWDTTLMFRLVSIWVLKSNLI